MDVIIIIPFDRCATPQLNTLSLNHGKCQPEKSRLFLQFAHVTFFAFALQICKFAIFRIFWYLVLLTIFVWICVSVSLPKFHISRFLEHPLLQSGMVYIMFAQI